MKKAIMALDGGGSNLRIVIVDYDSEQEIYFDEIQTGTNLTTVPNRQEAINNIQKLIIEGFENLPEGYEISEIGFSSAGTEIEQNRLDLAKALEDAITKVKENKPDIKSPASFVTNDIDILLHSADIALVAGTGTVGAVKYKDKDSGEYKVEKFDGAGQYIGDKGAGYWIGLETLTRVREIEDLHGMYVDSFGNYKFNRDSYLRKLVVEKILRLNGYSDEVIAKVLETSIKEAGLPDFIALADKATDNYDRAKIGNLFAKLPEEAAMKGDEVAKDILKRGSVELFKNIIAAYETGNFKDKPHCNLLLSGSVLVHNKVIRQNLEEMVKSIYPNVNVKVNEEKPVTSVVKYMKSKLKPKVKERRESPEVGEK